MLREFTFGDITMDQAKDIIRCEVGFARDFTHATDRPWGVLYHNREIPVDLQTPLHSWSAVLEDVQSSGSMTGCR